MAAGFVCGAIFGMLVSFFFITVITKRIIEISKDSKEVVDEQQYNADFWKRQ